jgi:hypothetical protein
MYLYTIKKRSFFKLVLLLLVIFFVIPFRILPLLPAKAALAERNFAARFTANINGDINMIGNVILTCPASANCTSARNGTLDWSNNNFNMTYVDVDSDATTINSSSATLNLSAGSSVLWAGLYWGGKVNSNCILPNCDTTKTDEVKIDPPGAAGYTIVNALTQDGFNGDYNSIADITSLVQGAGNGSYTVANVQAVTGSNTIAYWSMAIVYKNLNQPFRNLNVYDGYKHISENRPANIALNGFVTPSTGPVTAHIGLAAQDGDFGLDSDAMLLNSTPISDALNPANNLFNSSATYLGTRISAKNPDYINSLGLDTDVIDASNIIPNNTSSATVTLPGTSSTNTEAYNSFLISLAIDVKSQTNVAVQCTSKDTYVFTISSTTNLTSNVNKNFLYIAPRGTGNLAFQPQPGNTAVDTSIDKTINIGYEKSGVYTGMKHYTYSGSGWANTNANYVKATNTKINTPSASVPTLGAVDRYYVTTNTFTSGQTSNWQLTVKFNQANTFFNNFYANGFEAYLYMNDYTIMNFDLDSMVPSSDCNTTFFGTGGGDFRSNEPGYSNQFSRPSNKFWAVSGENNDTLTSTNFAQFPNPNPYINNSGMDVSEFGFEWKNPGTIDCLTKSNSNFCTDLVNPVVNRKQVAQNLSGGIDNALNTGYFLKIQPLSPDPALVTAGFYDNVNRIIYLDKITTRSPVLIEIENSINDITIVDSLTLANTPDVIAIRSLNSKCVFRVRSVAYPSSIAASNNLSVTYDTTTVSQFAKSKSRLYFNYDLAYTSNSTSINNMKRIVLTASDTTKINYYAGSFITSGFLYSSTSTKSDIIKGNVISRGIVARSTGLTVSTLYFKDGPNPFLYIDYDPKIMFSFKGLFTPVSTKLRTIVGL